VNDRVQSGGRRIEGWYSAYALEGVVVAGLIPILLPVFVSRFSLGGVGYVMAAFSLGGLLAPLWGELADKHSLHRALLTGGLLVTAGSLLALAFTGSLATWLLLAFISGSGSSAAATVANMFIVENHPKAEWDSRIGWLQSFYGAGQVAGLIMAAALIGLGKTDALIVSALLAVAAAGISVWKAPSPHPQTPFRPSLPHTARHIDWPIASPPRMYHITIAALRDIEGIAQSNFGIFLLAWVFSYGGATVVFSQYPVLMRNAFHIGTTESSVAFGAAAAIGLLLYAPAGRLTDRLAPRFVLLVGLAVRVIAIGAMFVLLLVHTLGWLAVVAFAAIVLAWSLLSVSSTVLVARISPIGEGSGIGLFNASTAVAGILGAAVGGWVAERWSYPAALIFATAIAALGLFGIVLRTHAPKPQSI
jgi:DHA1 family tetracycline resistance protein-like MFS transporter